MTRFTLFLALVVGVAGCASSEKIGPVVVPENGANTDYVDFLPKLRILAWRATEAFYRDHHAYTERDIRDLLDLRQRSAADGFVTTEKDASNLSGYLAALAPLAVVPVKMELADAANAVDTMLARIAERRRQP